MLKRRQDYQPPAFLVTSVYISIDIKDDVTDVITTLALRRNPDAAPNAALWLDGQGVELTRLVIDRLMCRWVMTCQTIYRLAITGCVAGLGISRD